MILVKKTALLSPRGAHGVSGVARFECFKEKSDVKINVSGGRKDLYAVVAVGDEKRVVKLGADRIYLARTDLSGDCAVIVADGEKRVLCAGATVCGYDFAPLEEFLPEAFGECTVKVAEEIMQNTEKSMDESESKGADTASVTESETVIADEALPMQEKTARSEAADISEAEKDVGDAEKTDKKELNSESGDEEIKGRFFDKIADKIQKLFDENEKDTELIALIPDSRWARVKAEDGWYVVGVIGDPVDFICYGIPGENALNPPEEDEGCRQWLEVEKGGRGYWMMYQSADNGKTLTAI